MLEPNDRRLLLESLRPPEGYELDFAIGTTFTLDLLSLLIAPIGFTFFELNDGASDVRDAIDPLVLLRTIRRYADRLAIFCQAGYIAVPSDQQTLFASLEESVVQVTPKAKGGIFHPKVWVLRYLGEDESVRYRFICLSRNLTFDRSWDTSLVMDGELLNRERGIRANHPLADFINELPNLAISSHIPSRIREFITKASDELRRVRFEVPAPFEEYGFWPLGISGYRKEPIRERALDRLLVASPFVTADRLASLGKRGKNNILVSRLDELQRLSRHDLAGFSSVLTLDPNASADFQQQDDSPSADPQVAASGLHAKLYVGDAGWDAFVWTGSANATDAGFGTNVEFLVELFGRRSKVGIDALLGGEEGVTSLRDLLVTFEPLETPELCDEEQQAFELRMNELRTAIGARVWEARVIEVEERGYTLDLVPKVAIDPLLLEGVELRCWPITLPSSSAQVVHSTDASIRFGPLTLEALTAFFAFEARVPAGPSLFNARFVVAAQLKGAPSDRRERLLQYQLRDPKQLVRFLLLLLVRDEETASGDWPSAFAWNLSSSGNGSGAADAEVLLEPMLRALDSNPAALDQVAETVEDLRKTADGAKVIPPGFDNIWNAIWQVRQQLKESAEVRT